MENAAVRVEGLESIGATSMRTGDALQTIINWGVEWLEGFKTPPEKEGDAPQPTLTYCSYKNAFRVFVQFLTGSGRALNRETARAFRGWLLEKQHDGASPTRKYYQPSTARNYFSIIRVFMKWLAAQGYCADYTATFEAIPHDTSTHAHCPLELDEAADVMNSFTGTDIKTVRDKAILAVLLTCGLRTVEVIRLNIEHVEGLENKRRKAVAKLSLWRKRHTGFDSKVILPSETLELIKDYLAARGIDVKSKNHRPLTDEEKKQPLFISHSPRHKGKIQRLTRQTISRIAKKSFRAVGVDDPQVVAHSCRNFAASVALDNGCSLDEVSKMLGHKNVETTEIYRNDQLADRNTATRTVSTTLFTTCDRKQKEAAAAAQKAKEAAQKKEAAQNVGG